MSNDQLESARKAAQAEAKKNAPKIQLPEDLSGEECLVQLLVAGYAFGAVLGLGAMPDGSALWLRIRVPRESTHVCAGRVAFCVDTDPTTLLRKALVALDASPDSKWWKADQFAR